jgi:hypothetical protein
MHRTRLVLLLIFASAKLAGADVVGTLNVHTARNGHTRTGLDTGLPVPVQVHDNQRTQADAWGANPGVGWYVTTEDFEEGAYAFDPCG